MIKALMYPLSFNERDESGIRRYVEALHKYMPKYDVQYVREDQSYDIIVDHAGASSGKADVMHCAGLYWTADYEADAFEYKVNRDVIESLRGAREVIVPSHWVAHNIARDMRFYPHVIGHGVDWKKWHPGHDAGFVLWSKNRNTDVCDPRPMYELARKFSGTTFVSTFLPRGVKSLHNISVTGVIPHSDMKELVENCSLYLATAKETFGIGILEAMASGKAILGYNHGGISDIVQHGVNGYLAIPGDIDDLINGFAYCMQYRKVLGANSRELVKKWSWERACEKIAQVYHRAATPQEASVTIVIPVYNYEDKVGNAIESALQQTYKVDIIVVDDGSTDRSYEVASSYGVRVIKQENQGVAVARNRGISESNTKYICCLDADDRIAPTFIEKCVEALEKDNSLGIAYTGLRYVTPEGETGISHWPGEWNYDRQLKGSNQVPTCSVFRKEVWKRLGGYNPRCSPGGAGFEDADFYLRAGAYGWKAAMVTDEALFIYSWRTGRVSSRSSERLNSDWQNEINYYKTWYPWFTDKKHPFASYATPAKLSHPVRQYDNPQVSVIIPVGPGHEHTFRDALQSIEAQTFRKWEAIVVWDSTEPCSEILRAAYPFVRWIETGEKKGAGFARNRGAESSRAPLLLFLDADDWLYPTFLQKTIAAFNNTHSAVYTDYTGKAIITDEDYIKKIKKEGRLNSWNGREAVITYHALDYDCEKAIREPNRWPFYIWCNVTTLFPRSWHEEIGGFDEAMESWEDWDYWLRMARAGKCFHRLEEPLMVYRFHTGSRRDWAHQGGGHNAQKLVKYLIKKYEEIPAMGCSGCGKKKTTVIYNNIERGVLNTMSDSDWKLCKFVHPNFGDQPVPVLDASGKRHIRYLTSGEKYLIHVADIKDRPDMFIPEVEKAVVQESKVTVSATKEPELIVSEAVRVAQHDKQAEVRAQGPTVSEATQAEEPEPTTENKRKHRKVVIEKDQAAREIVYK